MSQRYQNFDAESWVAEVIESSTTEFTAECRELNSSPPFGALVKAYSSPWIIYGVVHHISTQSIEPYRRPMAFGKTEEELRQEQPQIYALLRTHFKALVVGYASDDRPDEIIQAIPPVPTRLHTFVYECTPEEVRQFGNDLHFLRTIVNATRGLSDELLVAVCRHMLNAHGGQREYLVKLGKELCRLIRDDYHRLTHLLKRLESQVERTANATVQ
ncbi:HAS-barrel domain-containing protein [Fervidibacter sacchari]